MTVVNSLLMSCSNPTLNFVAAPALAPAEVVVDQNLMKQYAAELEAVRLYLYECNFGADYFL